MKTAWQTCCCVQHLTHAAVQHVEYTTGQTSTLHTIACFYSNTAVLYLLPTFPSYVASSCSALPMLKTSKFNSTDVLLSGLSIKRSSWEALPLTARARQGEGFHLCSAAAFGNRCEQRVGVTCWETKVSIKALGTAQQILSQLYQKCYF